ncbi:hypothetical protein M0R01_04525 [bacterium]|jgi:hypothetical protein|nr:hypothetical protein [bacterium]
MKNKDLKKMSVFHPARYLLEGRRLLFYNEILGYFETQEDMDKAIKESGIIKNKEGVWCIPLIVDRSTKREWIDSKYESYKRKLWGLSMARQEEIESRKFLKE